MKADSTRESWSCRCGTFRITAHAQVNQEELLVARDKKWCQEICTGMY